MKTLKYICLLFIGFAYITGCSGNYANLKDQSEDESKVTQKKLVNNWSDDDIRAMFETYEYDSTYNYFYSLGRWDRSPKAIVGINKDYVLVKESYPSDFTNWQQFEPGSEKLKELVDAMDKPTSHYYSSVGFIIYAPGEGDQIGIMYSASRFGSDKPEIRFKDGNQL